MTFAAVVSNGCIPVVYESEEEARKNCFPGDFLLLPEGTFKCVLDEEKQAIVYVDYQWSGIPTRRMN